MVGFVNRAASCYNQWFSPTAAAAHQLFLQGWNTNPGIFKSLPSFPFPILHCNSFFHHSPLFLIHPLSISSIISSVEAVAVEVSFILLLVLCVNWIPLSPSYCSLRVPVRTFQYKIVRSVQRLQSLYSVHSSFKYASVHPLQLVWNMRLQSAVCCSLFVPVHLSTKYGLIVRPVQCAGVCFSLYTPV